MLRASLAGAAFPCGGRRALGPRSRVAFPPNEALLDAGAFARRFGISGGSSSSSGGERRDPCEGATVGEWGTWGMGDNAAARARQAAGDPEHTRGARGFPLHAGPEPTAREVVEALNTADVESYPRFQKPFSDRLRIDVRAGNGGNPAPMAVRSPSLKGPGYAGNGGSVFLKASRQIESFIDIKQAIRAQDGEDGHGTHRGKHSDDLCVQVPVGTVVRERVYSGYRTVEGRRIFLPQFRYQLIRHDDTFLVAQGGTGGLGPHSFKKGDGRRGTPGERKRLELELRLLNDCAFVGVPNAGKTALLAALSRAHTRIGPEEFSTTRPHVGTILFRDRLEIRLCDLPGLKRGAHADKLMGRRILRHTYRSRALALVVDVARGERPEIDVLEEVKMLHEEACLFDPLNREKPWMVVGTKCDALHKDPLFHLDSLHFRLRAHYGVEVPVVGCSARFGLGLTRVVQTIRRLIYPDQPDLVSRVPAQPYVARPPGVLHGPLQDAPALPPPPLDTLRLPAR